MIRTWGTVAGRRLCQCTSAGGNSNESVATKRLRPTRYSTNLSSGRSAVIAANCICPSACPSVAFQSECDSHAIPRMSSDSLAPPLTPHNSTGPIRWRLAQWLRGYRGEDRDSFRLSGGYNWVGPEWGGTRATPKHAAAKVTTPSIAGLAGRGRLAEANWPPGLILGGAEGERPGSLPVPHILF